VNSGQLNSPRFASAPVSWGVWERTIDRDDLVPPEQLLEAVRSLGHGAIELGPPGYFGTDGAAVRARLDKFELELVGGFVPLHLADDELFRADLAELARTLEVLHGSPGAVALLADAGTPERYAAAGIPEALAKTALQGPELEAAAARLAEAAEQCRESGVLAALHPEVGSYIESPAEIEAFLDRVEAELLGICLDTGHTLIGGGDPLALVREWSDRLLHVHLKDVSGPLLASVRAGELDVETAWERGLFCPFGEGEVDLAGFLALPELESFTGWLVLEQDRMGVRIDDLPIVRAVEQQNLSFVRKLVAARRG
jgi:inosose dehydratase